MAGRDTGHRIERPRASVLARCWRRFLPSIPPPRPAGRGPGNLAGRTGRRAGPGRVRTGGPTDWGQSDRRRADGANSLGPGFRFLARGVEIVPARFPVQIHPGRPDRRSLGGDGLVADRPARRRDPARGGRAASVRRGWRGSRLNQRAGDCARGASTGRRMRQPGTREGHHDEWRSTATGRDRVTTWRLDRAKDGSARYPRVWPSSW